MPLTSSTSIVTAAPNGLFPHLYHGGKTLANTDGTSAYNNNPGIISKPMKNVTIDPQSKYVSPLNSHPSSPESIGNDDLRGNSYAILDQNNSVTDIATSRLFGHFEKDVSSKRSITACAKCTLDVY